MDTYADKNYKSFKSNTFPKQQQRSSIKPFCFNCSKDGHKQNNCRNKSLPFSFWPAHKKLYYINYQRRGVKRTFMILVEDEQLHTIDTFQEAQELIEADPQTAPQYRYQKFQIPTGGRQLPDKQLKSLLEVQAKSQSKLEQKYDEEYYYDEYVQHQYGKSNPSHKSSKSKSKSKRKNSSKKIIQNQVDILIR